MRGFRFGESYQLLNLPTLGTFSNDMGGNCKNVQILQWRHILLLRRSIYGLAPPPLLEALPKIPDLTIKTSKWWSEAKCMAWEMPKNFCWSVDVH